MTAFAGNNHELAQPHVPSVKSQRSTCGSSVRGGTCFSKRSVALAWCCIAVLNVGGDGRSCYFVVGAGCRSTGLKMREAKR